MKNLTSQGYESFIMKNLKIKINEIKNIKYAELEFPLESGIYALVGNNGCGKSTILQGLAQTISRYHLGQLASADVTKDTFIEFEYNGKRDKWTRRDNGYWVADTFPKTLKFNGMYEGSLFYGTRFADSKSIDDSWNEGKISKDNIVPADTYIIEKLSYILHGDYNHYKALSRLRNKRIASELGLSNTPYFYNVKSNLISQYRMSSGECLLVSLLHFIYNSLIRKSLPENELILMLIDEIELALHPIAVHRLLALLKELLKDNNNLVIYLTTHAPEVIRDLPPKSIYQICNNSGTIEIVNPCYPSYSIRDVYKHDGFDFLLLVEDILAKTIVDKILIMQNIKNSKLIHVVPAGGWDNVLSLQKDLLANNVLGVGKQIISILDGDIKKDAQNNYPDARKLFLPFASMEKFLYTIVVQNENKTFKKIISDKYFQVKSLDEIVAEFQVQYPHHTCKDNKKFYFTLLKDLEARGITEKQFTIYLAEDIMQYYDFNSFINSLKKMLS